MNREMLSKMSDADFEAIALAYWAKREPGCEEVTIAIRRDGKIIRFVLLQPGAPSTTLTSEEIAASEIS